MVALLRFVPINIKVVNFMDENTAVLSPVSTVSVRNAWELTPFLRRTDEKKKRLHFYSLALLKQARLITAK